MSLPHGGDDATPAPRRLYLEDAYLRSCTATVVARHEGCIELDQTVCYGHSHEYMHPQVSDKGTVRFDGTTLRIKRVDATPQRLFHYLEGRPLPARGAVVDCEVDFPRRLAVMRLHAAAHALLEVAEADLGVTPKLIASRSPEVETTFAQVYFDPDALTLSGAEDLVSATNRALAPPRPIRIRWLTRGEALARPDADHLRIAKIPGSHDPVRFVAIEGLCEHPCDGTLVSDAQEVGTVEVRELRRIAGGTKLVVGLTDIPSPPAIRRRG